MREAKRFYSLLERRKIKTTITTTTTKKELRLKLSDFIVFSIHWPCKEPLNNVRSVMANTQIHDNHNFWVKNVYAVLRFLIYMHIQRSHESHLQRKWRAKIKKLKKLEILYIAKSKQHQIGLAYFTISYKYFIAFININKWYFRCINVCMCIK